jgi:hypothetical protein
MRPAALDRTTAIRALLNKPPAGIEQLDASSARLVVSPVVQMVHDAF